MPVLPTHFLVRSKGVEIDVRTPPSKDVTGTLSFLALDFDSEFVFVGDAGTTEASRPSRRLGSEFTLHVRLLPWPTLDQDAAYTHARFLEDDPERPATSGRPAAGPTEGRPATNSPAT
jgi:hypothetical protein